MSRIPIFTPKSRFTPSKSGNKSGSRSEKIKEKLQLLKENFTFTRCKWSFKLCSDQTKANTKVKICFDVCRLFFLLLAGSFRVSLFIDLGCPMRFGDRVEGSLWHFYDK